MSSLFSSKRMIKFEQSKSIPDNFDDDSVYYQPSPEEEAKYAHVPNGVLISDRSELKELRKQMREQRRSQPE